MIIGEVYKHPENGRLVYITSGQYMGDYGVSNFWYWKYVRSDGTLGRTSCGYGWNDKPIKCKKVIKVITN